MTPDLIALDIALNAVRGEYIRARGKHQPMNSGHEGYAVIAEELDELWDDVKRDDLPRAQAEAVQVAAMAVAFMVEL